MAAQFHVQLPDFNGCYEAGVAIGVDPALGEDEKLRVQRPVGRSVKESLGLTLRWVWARFVEDKQLPDEIRDLIMYSVYAGLMSGMISFGDGDVIEADLTTQHAEPNGADAYFQPGISKDKITTALTVAVATKAAFWLTNHHLGGDTGRLGSYVGKVVALKMPKVSLNNDKLVEAVHTVGHWYSTKSVLAVAEVKGVAAAAPAIVDRISLKLSSDAILRFRSLPAGTHRLGVAYEAAKLLIRSRLLIVCPSPGDFQGLSGRYKEIISNGAGYHIGAQYLTGKERVTYDDSENDMVLGRLGTFVTIMMSKSTLAQSPHLKEARLQSYPDFDADFQAALQAIKLQSTKMAKTGSFLYQSLTETLGRQELETLCKSFDRSPTPSQLSGLRALTEAADGTEDSQDDEAGPSRLERASSPRATRTSSKRKADAVEPSTKKSRDK